MHEVPAAVLRLGNVYGPRQDLLGEAGVIAILCGKLADGGDPIVYGDGHQTRDYVYVGDVVEAMLVADQRLVAAGTDGALTYNIGTGLETSVLHLVERLGRIGDRSDFTPAWPLSARARFRDRARHFAGAGRARMDERHRARRRAAPDAGRRRRLGFRELDPDQPPEHDVALRGAVLRVAGCEDDPLVADIPDDLDVARRRSPSSRPRT